MKAKDRFGKASKVIYLKAKNATPCPICGAAPELMVRVSMANIVDFLCACFECKEFSAWSKDEREAVDNWNKWRRESPRVRLVRKVFVTEIENGVPVAK